MSGANTPDGENVAGAEADADAQLLPEFNEEALRAEYSGQYSRFEKLRKEVLSILEETVGRSRTKINNFDHRTKDVESIIGKCRRKDISALALLNDIVGLRIICLFRSDIDRIGTILQKNFEVQFIDDKLNGSVDEFGYMSVHYICRLPQTYCGPRYDDIKDISFEIQVRTAAMHAWASISHSIDYKREADVPADLRKSFNALSALFYLADTQFEEFAKQAESSRKQAERAVNRPHPPEGIPLDFDTLVALQNRYFSNREPPQNDKVSELLSQILDCGIRTAKELSRYLDYRPTLVEEFERSVGRATPFLNRNGAVRVILRLLSCRYRNIYKQKSGRTASRVERFRLAAGLADIDGGAPAPSEVHP